MTPAPVDAAPDAPASVATAAPHEEVRAQHNAAADAQDVYADAEAVHVVTARESDAANRAAASVVTDGAFDDKSASAPVAVDSQVEQPAQAVQQHVQPEPTAQSAQTETSQIAQGYAKLAEENTQTVVRSGKPTISLRDVTLIYPAQPNTPALNHVSLDIYPGEFAFVVGHSGSGKSTFLKLLTRELKATHGKVFVAGQDLTVMRNWKIPYLRRQIGTVYQDFKLLPDKTVYENVAFALECIGKPRSVIKAQVPEVLRLVGLAEKMSHYPDQLSGGEQQRVSVARAMVNRPPLLVCDEPTGNLDPAISLGIMKLLDYINRAGTTIVMATHDREMVDSMRKRVIALEAGSIVRDQEKGGYGYYGAL
ncbi:cell division ATP-binding protein FtsE [Fannyhessea vaginae PB189-T1-4]|uniref:Cell division ATP-binding protein FtsE n=1 Tax=Fannyhessea vaginae PB189-T1-4 TaxID=866774 RepID=A0ABN0AZG5_9ACTN|nr:cell division ATP-binding protein FtsE [Fannyhessea vaginae PB189-T1-4]